MNLNNLERKYKEVQFSWKVKILRESNRFKRFWKWVWYLIAFPFVWLFYNIQDYRSAICIGISFLLWSSSVWGFYLAALCVGWTATSIGCWLIGIGSAVWAWWFSPVGSPFILLVTFTSIALKALFNKVRRIRYEKK
jgi:hypothetical protein